MTVFGADGDGNCHDHDRLMQYVSALGCGWTNLYDVLPGMGYECVCDSLTLRDFGLIRSMACECLRLGLRPVVLYSSSPWRYSIYVNRQNKEGRRDGSYGF